MIWESLSPGRVLVDVAAADSGEVLSLLGRSLVEGGYCRESYVQALLDREAESPTGLDIGGAGVAIPHADPAHVLRPGLAMAALRSPVSFQAMGAEDEDDTVAARLVCALAIDNPGAHLAMVERLLEIIRDRSVVVRLSNAESAWSFIGIIRDKELALGKAGQ